MRFGVREICNVVFKATANNQRVGSKIFSAGEPVIYFDSLKTSTMEQATTTVYAQGGRGNTRLVAWEGEKTLTFTMEDALISEMGLAILAGANLYSKKDGENTTSKTLLVHVTETSKGGVVTQAPANDDGVVFYALKLDKNGEVTGAPTKVTFGAAETDGTYKPNEIEDEEIYLVDYYTEKTEGITQIDIEPQSFGGNFYIEADTLFRDTVGVDHAAQFVIPNGKIQSNFTLTMASSGDPSTFTFTVDAFPGYVNNDRTKKVMATIQIVDNNNTELKIGDVAGDKEDSTIVID
jgi:hypothetical protein